MAINLRLQPKRRMARFRFGRKLLIQFHTSAQTAQQLIVSFQFLRFSGKRTFYCRRCRPKYGYFIQIQYDGNHDSKISMSVPTADLFFITGLVFFYQRSRFFFGFLFPTFLLHPFQAFRSSRVSREQLDPQRIFGIY